MDAIARRRSGESAGALRAAMTAADQKRLTDQMSQVNCNPGVADPLQGNDDPNEFLVACGPAPTKSQPQQMVYLLAPKIISGTDVSKATRLVRSERIDASAAPNTLA